MPSLRRQSQTAAPTDPAEWRPQLFGRNVRRVVDPIIEPGWRGVRVIVRVESGIARITDEEGVDCTDEFAAVADAVGAAALAESLILEGHLTVEPTQAAEGQEMRGPTTPTGGQMMAQMFVGDRVVQATAKKHHLDPDRPIAFVAVDLLSVEGTNLLDVPLLERKRLLDGALEAGEIVRITPFVRPPLGTFVATWRSLGFEDLAYKSANSRYHPSGSNEEWALVPMPMR
jgi:ATP-dependent DNA ligase